MNIWVNREDAKQIENCLEFNLIPYIRTTNDIDNIAWIARMGRLYSELVIFQNNDFYDEFKITNDEVEDLIALVLDETFRFGQDIAKHGEDDETDASKEEIFQLMMILCNGSQKTDDDKILNYYKWRDSFFDIKHLNLKRVR